MLVNEISFTERFDLWRKNWTLLPAFIAASIAASIEIIEFLGAILATESDFYLNLIFWSALLRVIIYFEIWSVYFVLFARF